MADEYLTQVAAQTGLTAYPRQGPFGDKAGAAIGMMEGYIVAMGPGKSVQNEEQSAVNIMVRYKGVESADAVRAAIATHPGVLAALDSKEFKGKHGKQLLTGNDFLIWSFPYTLRKDKAEMVAAMARALVDAVKNVTPNFGGKCEVCSNHSVSEILLYNGTPGAFCPSCQENMRHETELAGRAYEMAESSPGRGLMMAAGAAVVGGLAWGGVAFLLNRIFLYAAIGIGFMVGWAYHQGAGKIDNMGRVAIGLLTVASVVFGDIFFIALILQRELQEPMSVTMFSHAVQAYVDSLGEGETIISLLFGLGGAAYAIYRWREPSFVAAFERLGEPAK